MLALARNGVGIFVSLVAFLFVVCEQVGAIDASPCLYVSQQKNVIISEKTIGPCDGAGISVIGSENVLIRDVDIRNTSGNGVHIIDSRNIRVTQSAFENNSTGVYVERSEDVIVDRNKLSNVQGPMPRGQFVQFNQVRGRSRIYCNQGNSDVGRSNAEDAISIYRSAGTSSYPISIDHNLILGGGPSRSGGGIMLGDGGGAWLVAEGNILLEPGQYGIAVAGGSNISIRNNVVFGRRRVFTNVGIYVWKQYRSACHNINVQNNLIHWINRDGIRNPSWDGRNCKHVTFRANKWIEEDDAALKGKLPGYCFLKLN